MIPEKWPNMTTRGVPEYLKIQKKRLWKIWKIRKMANKKLFWGYRFFIVFLMRFLMNFGSPGRPRGAPKIDFFASFFDFFARLSLQSCSWGLLGPFRVDFSSILVRFLVDFFSLFCRFAVGLLRILGRFWIDYFDRTPPLWKETLIRATKKEFNILIY